MRRLLISLANQGWLVGGIGCAVTVQRILIGNNQPSLIIFGFLRGRRLAYRMPTVFLWLDEDGIDSDGIGNGIGANQWKGRGEEREIIIINKMDVVMKGREGIIESFSGCVVCCLTPVDICLHFERERERESKRDVHLFYRSGHVLGSFAFASCTATLWSPERSFPFSLGQRETIQSTLKWFQPDRFSALLIQPSTHL